MARMLEARTVFVDEVVCALTGGLGAVPPRSLRDSLDRAAADFDEHTAEAFARALFEALEANPGDLRQREALLLLGLAHPAVFERHSISLASEAQRYAQLLEMHGEHERAREVLALAPAAHAAAPLAGETQATIQSLLARSEECIQRGYPRQAEEALREVLELDPSRSDVARMLSTLHSRTVRKRHLRKGVVVAGLLSIGIMLGVAGVVRHEQRLRSSYAALPPAASEDPASLQARLDALEALVDGQLPWSGSLGAIRERDQLRLAIQARQARVAEQQRQAVLAREQQLREAADLRASARVLVAGGECGRAIEQLSRALALGGEQWDARPAVLADIAAIEAWQRANATEQRKQ